MSQAIFFRVSYKRGDTLPEKNFVAVLQKYITTANQRAAKEREQYKKFLLLLYRRERSRSKDIEKIFDTIQQIKKALQDSEGKQ